MKTPRKNRHDSNYYWGLALMLTIPLALVLEFWKFSFCKPSHFPLYLLIYGWGYLLLFKSDCAAKIRDLEAELKKMIPPESTLPPEILEPEYTMNPASPEF
jgi:hypothetical protein